MTIIDYLSIQKKFTAKNRTIIMDKEELLLTTPINQYTYNKLHKFKCVFCKHLFKKQSPHANIKYCDGCRPRRR